MIDVEERDDIAVVWLDRPPVNALDAELLRDIVHTFRAIEESDARAVVLTGRGTAFSAGADLFSVLEGGPDYIEGSVGALSDAFEALFSFARPVVAAVNGHAIAGGCVLACACDHRIMSAGTIGLAELRVGVPFPTYALEIVRFAAGGSLQEIVYFGDSYSPDDALQRGLVDEVVPTEQLMERSLEVAFRLARIPTQSFELTKRALRRPVIEYVAQHGPAHDREVKRAWMSDEVTAAIRRFLERLFGSATR
jgi:enoyl-CoA hydratase